MGGICSSVKRVKLMLFVNVGGKQAQAYVRSKLLIKCIGKEYMSGANIKCDERQYIFKLLFNLRNLLHS